MKSNADTTLVAEKTEQSVGSRDQQEQALTDEALDGIREAEKVSGFGRFVLKLQGIFQRPRGSAAMAGGQWRLGPILVSASLLFLFAMGVLFLLSKPESDMSRHARQAGSLVGPEDSKPLPGGAYTPPPVAESQLVGSDAGAATQPLKGRAFHKNDSGVPLERSSFGPGPAVGSSDLGIQNSAGTGLQAPATVFTAGPSPALLKTAAPTQESTIPDFRLPAGTEIAAHTANAISSGLDSPVIAVVDRDVALNGMVVIPQGTQAIGQTAGAAKDRVNVRFTSLLLPDQRALEFSGLALMKDGSAGLQGKAQGSGHPVLAGAGRVATGAAVLATQFAGQGPRGLDRPFSEGDLLRNQLAAEIATEGTSFSNRLQRSSTVPIIKVEANQSIRIFLLSPMRVTSKTIQMRPPTESQGLSSLATSSESASAEEAAALAQAEYIRMLEAQVAQLRAALNSRQQAGQH